MKRKYIANIKKTIKSYVVEAETHVKAEYLANQLARADLDITVEVDLSEAVEVNEFFVITDDISKQAEVYNEGGHCIGTHASFDDAVSAVLEGSQ